MQGACRGTTLRALRRSWCSERLEKEQRATRISRVSKRAVRRRKEEANVGGGGGIVHHQHPINTVHGDIEFIEIHSNQPTAYDSHL